MRLKERSAALAAEAAARGVRSDVTIAIVSHRHSRYLDACLTSIFASTRDLVLDVALVDNLGEPEIEALVRAKFPQVRLIVNRERKGFSENNNQVLCPSASRYAMLLNPDTIVQPGALETLVAFMDTHPAVGACGPKLIYPDGRLQLSCRHFPTAGAFLIRRTPLRVIMRNSEKMRRYEMADWEHDERRSVDWLFGAAILIRRETLQQVGGLDEKMFLFSEDVDWCLRCHQAGWDIWYIPDAVIIHDFDDVKYTRYFTRMRWLHYKSMARFVRKHWRTCLKW